MVIRLNMVNSIQASTADLVSDDCFISSGSALFVSVNFYTCINLKRV